MTQWTQGHATIRTEALRRVLGHVHDTAAAADLLFLETWEAEPSRQIGTALRASQIRRANPALAAEIRAELRSGRPLTETERRRLPRGTIAPLTE